MNRLSQRTELALAAAVYAVAAAFWLIVFALSEPPEFRVMYLFSAIMVAVVATPWVFAVRLVARESWGSASLGELDWPARLVSIATASWPAERREWGTAMVAELAHVQNRSERWRFAAGCLRAILFPPRSSWWLPFLGVAFATATVLITNFAAGEVLPDLQGFLTTFVTIVGGLILLAAFRAPRLQICTMAATNRAAGVSVVAASIASTAYFIIRNPEAIDYFPPVAAAFLAVVLAVCLWLFLNPPRVMITHRVGRNIGLVSALLFGVGFVWIARMSAHTMGGPIGWTLFAPIVLFFAAGAIAAALGRSFRAGVEAALWATLLGTLLVFALSLPEAMHRFAIDGRTLSDGESGHKLAVNLTSAIWSLVQIPAFGLSFGVIGAAVGRRLRGGKLSTVCNQVRALC